MPQPIAAGLPSSFDETAGDAAMQERKDERSLGELRRFPGGLMPAGNEA